MANNIDTLRSLGFYATSMGLTKSDLKKGGIGSGRFPKGSGSRFNPNTGRDAKRYQRALLGLAIGTSTLGGGLLLASRLGRQGMPSGRSPNSEHDQNLSSEELRNGISDLKRIRESIVFGRTEPAETSTEDSLREVPIESLKPIRTEGGGKKPEITKPQPQGKNPSKPKAPVSKPKPRPKKPINPILAEARESRRHNESTSEPETRKEKDFTSGELEAARLKVIEMVSHSGKSLKEAEEAANNESIVRSVAEELRDQNSYGDEI